MTLPEATRLGEAMIILPTRKSWHRYPLVTTSDQATETHVKSCYGCDPDEHGGY